MHEHFRVNGVLVVSPEGDEVVSAGTLVLDQDSAVARLRKVAAARADLKKKMTGDPKVAMMGTMVTLAMQVPEQMYQEMHNNARSYEREAREKLVTDEDGKVSKEEFMSKFPHIFLLLSERASSTTPSSCGRHSCTQT